MSKECYINQKSIELSIVDSNDAIYLKKEHTLKELRAFYFNLLLMVHQSASRNFSYFFFPSFFEIIHYIVMSVGCGSAHDVNFHFEINGT